MAKALGVSVTDYTFEDCQLALAEGQLRLPSNTCLLEFAKLVRSLGLKPEKLEKDLDRYSESAKMKNGEKISLSEFAAYMEVPVSDTLSDMFALFDEDESGKIDLREYIIALSVVCRPSKTLETIQLAFKMYESQEDGSIKAEDLACILKTAIGVAELNVTDLFRAIDEEEKEKITFGKFQTIFATPHSPTEPALQIVHFWQYPRNVEKGNYEKFSSLTELSKKGVIGEFPDLIRDWSP